MPAGEEHEAIVSNEEDEGSAPEAVDEPDSTGTIEITDPDAEELDFNQSRIAKLQNLESLSRIQVHLNSILLCDGV